MAGLKHGDTSLTKPGFFFFFLWLTTADGKTNNTRGFKSKRPLHLSAPALCVRVSLILSDCWSVVGGPGALSAPAD